MDAVTRLHRQLVDYSNSLFQEGILDNQFGHLQQLQDESNPDFVAEVVNLYFKDSERLLNEITVALDQQNVDFTKVGGHVHQLKGSSSSIGAQRVNNVCTAFRSFCEEKNIEGCQQYLQHLKQEYYLVKNKLQTLFQLQQQLLSAGGSIPAYEMR
ncbi:hypothetical protein CISIN_1g031698mg [Citrus sinensis]|uniref:Histidine-containing phosphotransfer protein n=1 Tax=Citrus sinensis TaxID=2711 RepID=A0A067EC48_CITSI|nr:hypothetical protein CISIN_1g031698mg [Citrus sinensis]